MCNDVNRYVVYLDCVCQILPGHNPSILNHPKGTDLSHFLLSILQHKLKSFNQTATCNSVQVMVLCNYLLYLALSLFPLISLLLKSLSMLLFSSFTQQQRICNHTQSVFWAALLRAKSKTLLKMKALIHLFHS